MNRAKSALLILFLMAPICLNSCLNVISDIKNWMEAQLTTPFEVDYDLIIQKMIM